MRDLQNRHARSLVNSTRFHPNEAVLDEIDASNAMFAAYFIQFRKERYRIKPLAVNGNRLARLESDLKIFSFILRVFRRARHLKNIFRRLRPRILENPALV